ncbi:MAPEG family protein [Litoribrevibacter albus]|uniref:MAPEG family protein n=1 Tax=Litoribrevibacter albus TaxID=1473156 RepID=A0AA37S5G0_9GAMM|nr:MAPEG family protein [Litoribrevibacter albus]GLQ29631.1 hypothetical protein GCM10007876_01090 [Litoribrevibacter albus]
MILTTSTSIFYPAFAMFLLTMLCLLSLGMSRLGAIKLGKVKISFYRTYNQGTEPERLHLLSRHVHNHFEVPPLFYAGVLIAYVTNSATDTAVAFAWAFVITRLIHSAIHLTINNVTYRFLAFGAGLISVTGLWVTVFLNVI